MKKWNSTIVPQMTLQGWKNLTLLPHSSVSLPAVPGGRSGKAEVVHAA